MRRFGAGYRLRFECGVCSVSRGSGRSGSLKLLLKEIRMQCPKCQYVRLETDQAPSYECPSCGVIYSKYRPSTRNKRPAAKKVSEKSAIDAFLATAIGKFTLWLVATTVAILIVGNLLGETYGFMVLFGSFIVLAFMKYSKAEAERLENLPVQHCMTCGHDFKAMGAARRGNGWIEVVLWVCFLWPIALVYTIWRRAGSRKARVTCVVCASDQVVPALSPAAVAHKKSLGISD